MQLCAAADVNAQPDKTAHDCKRAEQIVAKGKPEKKDEWAWGTVVGCGAEGGIAAHDAWIQARTVTDTSQLHALYRRLWNIRDSALFDAAQHIFVDQSASPQSRVYSAMLLLVQLFDHKSPVYADFVSTTTYSVCQVNGVYGRTIYTGTPLLANAAQLVRSAAQGVLASSGASAIVQSAARCVDQELMLNDRLHPPNSTFDQTRWDEHSQRQ
jgi:hypothetical protein